MIEIHQDTGVSLFFGNDTPLSNWYPAEFVVDDIRFYHVEQYMMYQKAILFQDLEMAKKIVSKKYTPKYVKSLGRKVKNFDEKMWAEKSIDIVTKGVVNKFIQNPPLLVDLYQTKGTMIAEASPYDKIWGIGLSVSHKNSQDVAKWKGKNLLGKILTCLRIFLLKEDMKIS